MTLGRPARIILVRHGQSEGNRTRTFTPTPAVALTDLGREQARSAAEEIAARYRALRIVASPYVRARQTAEIIAGVLRLEVEADDTWREQSYGNLAGQPYDSVREDPSFDSERMWAWRPPGGESLVEVRERVCGPFDRLCGESVGQDVVLVSHAGVMQALCAHITGDWAKAPIPPNGGIVVVQCSVQGRSLLSGPC